MANRTLSRAQRGISKMVVLSFVYEIPRYARDDGITTKIAFKDKNTVLYLIH